jgi:hypothetical protein
MVGERFGREPKIKVTVESIQRLNPRLHAFPNLGYCTQRELAPEANGPD